MKWIKKINKILYKNYADNWDDEIFRKRIVSNMNSDSICLDLAAGAGIISQMNFRGAARAVHGIDLDERVLENPYLDHATVGNCEKLPYNNETFDLVIADNLLEHLEKPDLVFREVSRVLKTGGKFLFKTPNKFHYMPLISSLTPHSFHKWYNNLRGRETEDTFPTLYRANSKGDIKRLTKELSLKIDNLSLIEGRPEYLKINVLLYILGAIYERIVNLLPFFSSFRILLIGELKKIK